MTLFDKMVAEEKLRRPAQGDIHELDIWSNDFFRQMVRKIRIR